MAQERSMEVPADATPSTATRGFTAPRPLTLAYCDYIADCIKQGLHERIQHGFADLLRHVGPVKLDLHPTEGWFVSTKKTIEVTDQHGKLYRVTVEEIAP